MPFQTMTTPWGSIDVPDEYQSARGARRGWNAADELALAHVAEADRFTDDSLIDDNFVIVVNDRCGALSVALALSRRSVIAAAESVSQRARISEAIRANSIDPTKVTMVSPVAEPGFRFDRTVGLVLVVVPTDNATLERQLDWVRNALVSCSEPLLDTTPHNGSDSHTEAVPVVGIAMTKDVHRSTISIFGERFGETSTSLAVKKARLLHSVSVPARTQDAQPTELGGMPELAGNPEPASYDVRVADFDVHIRSFAGVFGSEQLDAGTRLLLSTASDWNLGASSRVVDAGCGSGVLGVVAAAIGAGHVLLMDDSDIAVESARATVLANTPLVSQADMNVVGASSIADAVDKAGWNTVDLIVTNPPFHHGRTMADDVAWAMMVDARGLLRPGGELWMVGNRNLGYHAKLKRHFSRVEVVTSDRRFVVLRATS